MNNEQLETARRIARQSQMERAIEYYTLIGKQPSITDLVMTAELLQRYIMNGWDGEQNGKSLKESLNKMDKYLEKEYLG